LRGTPEVVDKRRGAQETIFGERASKCVLQRFAEYPELFRQEANRVLIKSRRRIRESEDLVFRKTMPPDIFHIVQRVTCIAGKKEPAE